MPEVTARRVIESTMADYFGYLRGEDRFIDLLVEALAQAGFIDPEENSDSAGSH